MISVVGSLNMDLMARVTRLPEPGETVLAREFQRSPGAKGANQAVAAARAGSTVEMVGRVGDDLYGRELLESLSSAGVVTRHVRTDAQQPTGLALIAVDEQGQNEIVVVPGANAALTPEDVDAAADAISASAIVLLQLEIPLPTVSRAVSLARQAGSTIVLNPSPARPLNPAFLACIDLLVLNAREVAQLSGVGPPIEPAEAARLLVDGGVGAVVVTLGAEGAVIVSSEGETDVPAFPVEPVDTTGAGDAFLGNLAHALESGGSLPEAARFASAAAAASVLRPGAQPSLPTLAQTQAILARDIQT